MKIFFTICLVIVLALWLYRGWSYYSYKKSGSILFISSFRNWPLISAWLAIGALQIIPALDRYKMGMNVGGYSLVELIFWVLIISLSITSFAQLSKITQGGILYNGDFWQWRDIVSWEWDKNGTKWFTGTAVKNVYRHPRVKGHSDT